MHAPDLAPDLAPNSPGLHANHSGRAGTPIGKKSRFSGVLAHSRAVLRMGGWCQKNTPIGTQVADFLRELAVGNHRHHQ